MGPCVLAFHRPRRAGGPRFLARARAIFSRNRMNVRPISVEGGFAMISRHEGIDLGRSELCAVDFPLEIASESIKCSNFSAARRQGVPVS